MNLHIALLLVELHTAWQGHGRGSRQPPEHPLSRTLAFSFCAGLPPRRPPAPSRALPPPAPSLALPLPVPSRALPLPAPSRALPLPAPSRAPLPGALPLPGPGPAPLLAPGLPRPGPAGGSPGLEAS